MGHKVYERLKRARLVEMLVRMAVVVAAVVVTLLYEEEKE